MISTANSEVTRCSLSPKHLSALPKPLNGIFLIIAASKGRKVFASKVSFQEYGGEIRSLTRASNGSLWIGDRILWLLEEGIHLSCHTWIWDPLPMRQEDPVDLRVQCSTHGDALYEKILWGASLRKGRLTETKPWGVSPKRTILSSTLGIRARMLHLWQERLLDINIKPNPRKPPPMKGGIPSVVSLFEDACFIANLCQAFLVLPWGR